MKFEVETYNEKEPLSDIPEEELFIYEDEICFIPKLDDGLKKMRSENGSGNDIFVIMLKSGELDNILASTLVTRCKKLTIEKEV